MARRPHPRGSMSSAVPIRIVIRKANGTMCAGCWTSRTFKSRLPSRHAAAPQLALVGCGSYARLTGHVGSRHLRFFDEPAILRRTGRQAVRAATAWPARAMTSSSPRPATVRAA
ncbi:hypothetical protein PO78_4385 [Thauera sp. SWB20]|nr:hypothetical protein PO78_4385 [Thauera sp. SWB20]